MKFTEILEGLKTKTLNVAQAAEQLGFSEVEMEKRLGIWGRRIWDLFKVFDLIENDRITRSEAAGRLGVGVREVNHLMQSWNVQRPLKEYLVVRAITGVKWELHKKWAIGFVADECTIEDAAMGAGLSTRQMRRWISELLDKHYGMVFKDLKHLSLARRRRLADEMETAEGIELAKKKVLDSIVNGGKTLEEEALERVLSSRKHERRANVRRKSDETNR